MVRVGVRVNHNLTIINSNPNIIPNLNQNSKPIAPIVLINRKKCLKSATDNDYSIIMTMGVHVVWKTKVIPT